MAIETSWLAEGRVLDVRIYDAYRRDDVAEMNTLTQQALDDYPDQNVYILADCVDMTQILFSPQQLLQLFTLYNEKNFGGLVIYGVSWSLRTLAQLMAQVIKTATRANVVFVDTREDALEYLNDKDATLDIPTGEQDTGR